LICPVLTTSITHCWRWPAGLGISACHRPTAGFCIGFCVDVVGADESDPECRHAQMPAAITIARAKRTIALIRNDRDRRRIESPTNACRLIAVVLNSYDSQ